MLTTDTLIVVEEFFNTSAENVWKAITELDQMKQWFFDNIPAFKAEKGFQTQFNVDAGERNFLHLWTITEAEACKKIVYDWRYQEYPGAGLVTFELFEENGSTKLRLTNEVVEDFPQDIPEFKRESCEGGWKYFIKQNLKSYIEKKYN